MSGGVENKPALGTVNESWQIWYMFIYDNFASRFCNQQGR